MGERGVRPAMAPAVQAPADAGEGDFVLVSSTGQQGMHTNMFAATLRRCISCSCVYLTACMLLRHCSLCYCSGIAAAYSQQPINVPKHHAQTPPPPHPLALLFGVAATCVTAPVCPLHPPTTGAKPFSIAAARLSIKRGCIAPPPNPVVLSVAAAVCVSAPIYPLRPPASADGAKLFSIAAAWARVCPAPDTPPLLRRMLLQYLFPPLSIHCAPEHQQLAPNPSVLQQHGQQQQVLSVLLSGV